MDPQTIRNELKTILGVVDSKLAERDDLTDATALRDGLGLDSLQVTELLFEIEERLGAKISDEEARTLQTIGDLVAMIAAKTA